MISLDTETTGLDFFHGARPFFVTTCDEEGNQQYWEWDVEPLTRKPIVPAADANQIRRVLNKADGVVLQNAKFDIRALATVGIDWLCWDKTEDTLIAGHLLASNQPHDLTIMALIYLGVNIQPFEDDLKKACMEARKTASNNYPDWRIAKAGLPDMPSIKDNSWKVDSWLPRALAKQLKYPKDHPWWTVTRDYANADSAITIRLWRAMRDEILKRGYDRLYRESLKKVRLAHDLEVNGVTLSKSRLIKRCSEFGRISTDSEVKCVSIAKQKYDYDLTLPKSGNNKSLLTFVFEVMKLEPHSTSEVTGAPSLNKEAMDHYEISLDGDRLDFIMSLRGKRKHDTALSYMHSYTRFWHHLSGDFYRLHPNNNPTGTDTIRWSNNNPNGQNISGQEEANVRYCFGPAPGREWWAMDGQNLELRLPAYKAGEQAMIDLFEHPDDPPYFGSNHLLIAHILHPEKFDQCLKDGVSFKDRYKSSWYRRVKSGNFAITCGAVMGSGTADRAYGVPGAQRRIASRMSNIAKLSASLMRHAERYGYIETIPDRSVDPEHGYPLLCKRTQRGRILATTPFSYWVQGSATWWMNRCMDRCGTQINSWNEEAGKHLYWMTLQVHDELIFDFPCGKGSKPWLTNLPKARCLQRLMQQCGDDLGVPTPVSVEYFSGDWSHEKGVQL